MISLAVIRGLEERSFNAWPSLQTVIIDDWLVRLSGGFTRRANSASALRTDTKLDPPTLRAIENLYHQHSIPPVFRISPLSHPSVGKELESARYVKSPDAVVMMAENSPGSEPTVIPNHVQLVFRPTIEWLDAYALTSPRAPELREHHDAMLRSIAFPSAYAAIHLDGKQVAFGIGVLEREMVGIFHIFVEEQYRGRGLAKDVTSALVSWGHGQGATGTYLQVAADNVAAFQLYTKLGFTETYRYHYLAPKRK